MLLVSGELKPSYVLGFCIATSNAVGLLGGLFLLGYGLIAIPKQARLPKCLLHSSLQGHDTLQRCATVCDTRSCVPQLWFTASVKGEERALHHRAGLQHIKAVAARQCALPCSACRPMVSWHTAITSPMPHGCGSLCVRVMIPSILGLPISP